MSVLVKHIGKDEILMSDVPVGEVFFRHSDRLVAIKSNETCRRKYDEKHEETAYLCLDLRNGQIHRISEETRVQVVPRTDINLHWHDPASTQ